MVDFVLRLILVVFFVVVVKYSKFFALSLCDSIFTRSEVVCREVICHFWNLFMNFVSVMPDSLNSRSVLDSQGVIGGHSLRKTRKIMFLVSLWLVSATSNSMFGNSPRLLSGFFRSFICLHGGLLFQFLIHLALCSDASRVPCTNHGCQSVLSNYHQWVSQGIARDLVERIECFCGIQSSRRWGVTWLWVLANQRVLRRVGRCAVER